MTDPNLHDIINAGLIFQLLWHRVMFAIPLSPRAASDSQSAPLSPSESADAARCAGEERERERGGETELERERTRGL